jgi:hypothetical protein
MGAKSREEARPQGEPPRRRRRTRGSEREAPDGIYKEARVPSSMTVQNRGCDSGVTGRRHPWRLGEDDDVCAIAHTSIHTSRQTPEGRRTERAVGSRSRPRVA